MHMLAYLYVCGCVRHASVFKELYEHFISSENDYEFKLIFIALLQGE